MYDKIHYKLKKKKSKKKKKNFYLVAEGNRREKYCQAFEKTQNRWEMVCLHGL